MKTTDHPVSVGTSDEWTDLGPLGNGRYQHIRRVQNPAGVQAVLKRGPKGSKGALRFADEARNMRGMSPTTGVLRVLDIDPGVVPKWYVMERATLLGEALGKAPDLRDVVEAVAAIAKTLADLDFAHRDIKPDNLFYARSQPLIGDFGIAAWPTRSNVTAAGDKVGPAHFIAPESRQGNGADPRPADVWSLAKSLFVLALPELGSYPPGGTHFVTAPGFSLSGAGGTAAAEIESVLEAATDRLAGLRPSMRRFADELDAWVQMLDPDEGMRPPQPALRRGIGPDMLAEVANNNRRKAIVRKHLRSLGPELAEGLGLDARRFEWESGGALLGSDFPDGDGWEPDGYVAFCADVPRSTLRIVVAGVIEGASVEYVAEVLRAGESLPIWSSGRVEALAEAPSGRARCRELTPEILNAVRPELTKRGNSTST